MPGAGTDKTKRWIEQPAPIVVLVEPQLGENIGAAVRAMANFGLSQLRVVKPVQSWPNEKARVMAAGADRVLNAAVLYDSLADAIGDCTFVLAATARNHDQAKPVISADAAAAEMAPRVVAGAVGDAGRHGQREARAPRHVLERPGEGSGEAEAAVVGGMGCIQDGPPGLEAPMAVEAEPADKHGRDGEHGDGRVADGVGGG
ncbi:MAG: TrmH family RNA methyltransferase, partial [Pseudomonadota bacterium]